MLLRARKHHDVPRFERLLGWEHLRKVIRTRRPAARVRAHEVASRTSRTIVEDIAVGLRCASIGWVEVVTHNHIARHRERTTFTHISDFRVRRVPDGESVFRVARYYIFQ